MIGASAGVIESLLTVTGPDLAELRAARIRRFVIETVSERYASSPGHVTTTVRSFLGFLAARGRCAATLVDAVPTIASSKDARLPEFVAPGDVERVIAGVRRDGAAAAKDRDGATTARDHAMLLLLARLGLRSGDVRGLRIGDIDWKHGRVRLVGKGRRETHLPLPQDAGDAILAYLAKRPPAATDQVFSGREHPIDPSLARACTTRWRPRSSAPACRRPRAARTCSGTRSRRGCCDGATLDTIGAVSRHRQISTTAIYSKVDVELLRQIAQPWPGTEVAPC